MKATLRHRIRTLFAAAVILLAAPRLLATPPAFTDFPVGDDASLRAAIVAAGDGDTITFTGDITLAADLPAVQTNIMIDGQGHTLSGDDLYRGFFVGKFSGATQVAVTVVIHDLTITLASAHGGNGGWGDAGMSGGGGAGLGGAIFVANLAQLTIENVTLQNNTAEGGAGGVFSGQPGVAAAGGGMGGDGGHATALFAGAGGGGGGGLGRGATGGKGSTGGAGSPGIATGALPGGNGASGNPGGAAGGGGGSGTSTSFNAAAGGGVGGANGVAPGTGGNGGFGGGGGGLGGDGGYGGGGSGGGGNGGFGGGGGAGSGAGGWAGGAGGAQTAGGGAALGGALFVQAGGSLTIQGNLTIDGNTLQAGPAVLDGVNGSTFGSGLFAAGNGTLTFNPAAGETQTIANDIADQSGSGGLGPDAGIVALTKTGAGTLVLGGTNTYSGLTTVSAGTLIVNGVIGLSSQVLVEGGATLGGAGTVGLTGIEPDGWLAPDGVLHVSDLAAGDGGRLAIDLHGAAPGSYDQVAVAGVVYIADAKLSVTMDFSPTAGDIFTIIDTAATSSLTGTFESLPNNAVMTVNGRHLRINYGDDVTLTVLQETPAVSGNSSAGVVFGGSIHDTATITGGFNPTGSVTFRAYGPSDATCSAAPVFANTAPVSAGSATSSNFTPTSAGVYRWIASYSGDLNNAASATACGNANQTVTIAPADQTITIDPIAPKTFGDAAFPVSATATSTLPVTLSSLTTGVCTMADATHVQIVTAGTCTVAATQLGDGNYNAAPQITRDVAIAKADQTIAFPSPGGKTFGDAAFLVGATATSTLPVSFSSLTTDVCAMADATHVQIVAAGTCTVAATQLGDSNYNAAPQATQDVAIATANQTITFAPLGPKLVDDLPFPITATATSNLAVTFESQTQAVCNVNGSTVTLVGLGTCTIVAIQIGNGNYNAAPQITRSFTVAPNCAIVSTGPAQLPLGVVGLPYSQAFSLTGGPAPATFTLAGTLPAGLTFSNGTIAGTPTAHGAFAIAVTGTDANACQATVSVSLAVSAERRLIVGAGAGGASTVHAFTLGSATLKAGFEAFAAPFAGGVTVAQGDVNGDGAADIIAGAGPGGSPTVAVFDAAGVARLSFLAFEPSFHAGVNVAAGDVTGDGIPEILVAPGCTDALVVRAFDGRSGVRVREYPIAVPNWSCGLHLAAGDVTGDGWADLIVGAGGLSPSFVAVVDGLSGDVIRQSFPYSTGFTGGIYVAAADVTGDGIADIIMGAGPGGGPHVLVTDGLTGAPIGGPLAGFMAYDPAFAGGVRVAAGDLNGDGRAEVITGAGAGAGPHVRVWDGATATEVFGLLAIDPAFAGGVFVAGPPATGRMSIDLATAAGGAVRVAGWALREGLGHSVGTDAIHVWAFPVGGGTPSFVGAATERGARADVAAVVGGEFLMSGFDVSGTLPPGTYDLVVYVRNSRTLRFDQARLVHITVN